MPSATTTLSNLIGVSVVLGALLQGCAGHDSAASPSTEDAIAIAKAAREFATHVAEEVTQHGPLAWRDQFANSPNFFMVSDGQLAFANGEAAMRGIDDLPKSIAKIELQWREPILADALTPSLAMLAMPFHETIVDTAGGRKEIEGYFTGVAERGASGWKFRNAHWSIAPGPSVHPN